MNPEYRAGEYEEKIDHIKEKNKAIMEFIQDAEKKLEFFKSAEEKKEYFLTLFFLLGLHKAFDDFMEEAGSEKGKQKIKEMEKRLKKVSEEIEKSLKEK